MRELSDRQLEVLEFVRNFISEHGHSPTHREICKAMGISSVNGVKHHLDALVRKGCITINPKMAHGIRLTASYKVETYTEKREHVEAEKRAEEKARREREAAEAREKYLDRLESRKDMVWAEIDGLVSTKQPKKYDLAVERLRDLRDLDQRSSGGEFQRRLETLRQKHSRKPSLLDRIKKAKL